MPRSPPRKAMIFRTASAKPGTARNAWSAARSAGCSQETPAICGKATRERGAGTEVMGFSVVWGAWMYALRSSRFQVGAKTQRRKDARWQTVNCPLRPCVLASLRHCLVQVGDQVLHILALDQAMTQRQI